MVKYQDPVIQQKTKTNHMYVSIPVTLIDLCGQISYWKRF